MVIFCLSLHFEGFTEIPLGFAKKLKPSLDNNLRGNFFSISAKWAHVFKGPTEFRRNHKS